MDDAQLTDLCASDVSILGTAQIAAGAMDKKALPDLTQTTPAAKIGPHPSWGNPEKVL